MSNINVDLLQDLLELAIDSRSFCTSAAAVVENPALGAHLRHMAAARDDLITRLAAHRARADRRGADGTAAGDLRHAYAEMLEAMAGTRVAPAALTAQLEEAEHRLLSHFDQALAAAGSAEIRGALLELLPGMRALHADIQNLRARTRA